MFTILIECGRSTGVHLVWSVVRAMDLGLNQCESLLVRESIPMVGLGDFIGVTTLQSFQV